VLATLIAEKKRHGGEPQKANFGHLEPLAYLAVWQGKATALTRDEHCSRDLTISLDHQKEWLVNNGYL